MKMLTRQKLFISIILSLSFYGCYKQSLNPAFESFEDEQVLEKYFIEEGTLSLKESFSRFGTKSLHWKWNKAGSSITTSYFRCLKKEESPLKYDDFFPSSPTFMISIYNPRSLNSKIEFLFGNKEKNKAWFSINLEFQGWRRIWVPFHEMNGPTVQKGEQIDFDRLRIFAKGDPGDIFIDDIIFSQYQDDRYPYPDHVVPFIKQNKDLGSDHWMPLATLYSKIVHLPIKPSLPDDRNEVSRIESYVDSLIIGGPNTYLFSDSELEKLFSRFNLQEKGNTIAGPPLTYRLEEEYHPKKKELIQESNEIKDLGEYLILAAKTYRRSVSSLNKKKLEYQILTIAKYFLEQGWKSGASGGTRHHFAYATRRLLEGFYLMKDILKKEDLLDDITHSFFWLYNLGEIVNEKENIHVNLDYLNTKSFIHLMLILMEQNEDTKTTLLEYYSGFISTMLAQKDQKAGFKIDGTCWHHNGHYPAYGLGAFKSVSRIIWTLSESRFKIKIDGHKNFRNALLATRIYSQLYDFGFGNAGRHPLDGDGMNALKESFLCMLSIGAPDNSSAFDKEIASAYIRLWGEDGLPQKSIFLDKDITSEPLQGHYTFPYAATAVHRRENWAAIIKGYSKYVWSSEIYAASNRYGRYPSNGTIQILNEQGEIGSGFDQNGWDWNRYPGATVIYLPFEELETDLPLLMFRSEEKYAGATSLNNFGAFGFILNESKGSNADGDNLQVLSFPGKLKARKSVFSFDKELLCLGSNISSVDQKNSVETILFQSSIKDTSELTLISNGQNIRNFRGKSLSQKNSWLIDPIGHGYQMLSDHTVKIQYKNQESFHNKYSIRTGATNKKGGGAKMTKGNFMTAFIDHGISPDNASYAYLLYPFVKTNEKMISLVEQSSRFYIQQQDSIAHIVTNRSIDMKGYVIFESNQIISDDFLLKVSEPTIILKQEINRKKRIISVAVPDLNFTELEANIFDNRSRAISVEIDFKGLWKIESVSHDHKVTNHVGRTTLIFNAKDGLPTIFEMIRG